MTQQVSPGRIVHYRLGTAGPTPTTTDGKPGLPPEPIYRPAMVVRVWNYGTPDEMVNLIVYPDGSNDWFSLSEQVGENQADKEVASLAAWRTSVHQGDGDGQWCWPPKV